ncbi:MAG: ATP-binding protein, partial [Candidatus Hydrogenedentes bacterium]|nr:ATP-binding protein [Candidatus Hydrogenedentota bacterium]
ALLGRGLVTEELRSAAFHASNSAVEARNPEAWAMARRWRATRNLYVHGPTGVGKSYLARCCLNRVFQQGQAVAEVSARRFAKISDTFAEGGGLFSTWIRTEVLLLDDIDKANWSVDRVGALWELLDARASARRWSIVTGNVSPRELLDVLRERSVGHGLRNNAMADATLERLRPCVTLCLEGESLRSLVTDSPE